MIVKRGLIKEIIPPGVRLRDVPWRNLLISFRKQVEETGELLVTTRKGKDTKVDKRLSMLKMVLLHNLEKKAKQAVDGKFFLEVIELLARAEELIEMYEHDVEEWLDFLETLEKKLEEEGLLLEDEELAEQGKRLKSAIEKLRAKLE